MSKRATIEEMMQHLLHAGADDWQAVQLWTRLYYAAMRGARAWEPGPWPTAELRDLRLRDTRLPKQGDAQDQRGAAPWEPEVEDE